MPLHTLGSTAHYDVAPYYPEERLATFAHEAFVHPVLDRRRFIGKMLGKIGDPAALLDRHQYRDIMTDDVFAAALPHIHHALWVAGRDDACGRVVATMRRIGDPAYLHLHGLDGHNLALGRPALQSSTSEWSLRPDEAAGAVTGPVSGRYRFHTREEAQPWWMVDLQSPQPVALIRVFNRMDVAARANGLNVFVSIDGVRWDRVGGHEDELPFGGADGNPLVVAVDRVAKFVLLRLPGVESLHLDQVQVLGPPSAADQPNASDEPI